jgi:hypothetical protein
MLSVGGAVPECSANGEKADLSCVKTCMKGDYNYFFPDTTMIEKDQKMRTYWSITVQTKTDL